MHDHANMLNNNDDIENNKEEALKYYKMSADISEQFRAWRPKSH